MRFHYGSVPDSPGFQPEAQGWRGIRDPGPWLLQLLAVPPAFLLLAVDLALLEILWPRLRFSQMFAAISPPAQLAVMLALGPLHELIHLAFHPGGGMTSASVFGLWPSRGMLYAHYDGPISRSRTLIVLAAPCIIMAAVPAVLIAVLGGLGVPAALLHELAFLSVYGAVTGCGDVVVILQLLFQVPSFAMLRNQGWKTYWKAGSQA